MRWSRFTQEQITDVLKEHQTGLRAADLCRKHGLSNVTSHTWHSKYGLVCASGAVGNEHSGHGHR